MYKLLIVLCGYVGLISGQVIRWGACPDIQVIPDFNITAYLGRWYEQQRYFAFFEWGLSCVTAEYTQLSDGQIRVNNTGTKSNGQSTSALGTGYAPDPAEPAKLSIKFDGKSSEGAYWVLDTDYQNYSVVYACSNVGPFRAMFAWLLSRDQEGFPHDAQEKIERVLWNQGIDKTAFRPTDQVLTCDGNAANTIENLSAHLI